MPNILANIAKMDSATTGTGTLTLGAAVTGYLSFANAGVTNSQVVTYAIEDYDVSGNIIAREVGAGTYSSTGPTLTRDTVYSSTNAGAKISCSGLQYVFVSLAKEDLATFGVLSAANTWTADNRFSANVGLGVDATSSRLTVKATASNVNATTWTAQDDGSLASIFADSADGAWFRLWDGAGTEQFRLRSGGDTFLNATGGNVGIGTTSPVGTLHTVGTSAIFLDRAGATASHLLVRTANGTVSSPTAILNTNNLGRISFQGYDGTQWASNSTAGVAAFATENWSTTARGSQLQFLTTPNTTVAAVERMTIDNAGNVGIGTTGPGKRLDVVGQLRASNTAASGYALFEYGSSATATNNWHVGSEGDGTFRWYNGTFGAGTERMRIDASGNLGVGSTAKTRLQATAATTLNAPVLGSATNAPFYVTNVDASYGLLVGNSSATGDVWLQAQRTDGTATAYNINLNPVGGRVGIGTASPTGNLTVFSSAANDSSHIRVETSVRPSLSLINSGVQAWSFWVDTGDSNKLKIGSANGGISTGTPYMTVTTGGGVGIGTAAPDASMLLDVAGPIRSFSSTTNPGVFVTAPNTSAFPGAVVFQSYRTGTTPAQTGDNIGYLDWRNHVYNAPARITVAASETHGATASGANIRFSTCANGSATLTDRLYIRHDGCIGVNRIPDTGFAIDAQNVSGDTLVRALATNQRPVFLAEARQDTGYAPAFFTMRRHNASATQTPSSVTIGELRWDGLTTGSAFTTFAGMRADIGTNSATGAGGALTFSTAAGAVTNDLTDRLQLNSRGVLYITNDLGPASADTQAVGFRGSPNNDLTGAYTLALTDAGRTVRKTSTTLRTVTIPADSTVNFPLGTCIMLCNVVDGTNNSATVGALTVACAASGPTLVWMSGTTKNNRTSATNTTIAGGGSATLRKVAANLWTITGAGIA